MHFEPSAYPAEMAPMLRRFIGITGWDPWKRRFKAFESWIAANPLMENFIAERYPVEIALAQAKNHIALSGRLPTRITSSEQYRLFSFISMTVRVYQRLNAEAQKRFAGAIRGALRSDSGLSPFVAEMVVAGHLMAKSFDVEFHDFEGGGGFDFLATKEDVELEVECKHISGDIGRQIHKKKLYDLGGVSFAHIADALNRNPGGQFVRIKLPGRLTGQTEQLTRISDYISVALMRRTNIDQPKSISVEYEAFSIVGTPFDSLGNETGLKEAVRDYLERKFGAINPHVLMHFRPNHGAVVLVVESEQRDKVMKGIISQLKEAGRSQLTGKRPGILCVYLSDMDYEQLRRLAESEGTGNSGGTGIQYAITHLFERRPLLHTVALMGEGPVYTTTRNIGARSETFWQERGGVYAFKNREHSFSDDPRCAVF